MQIKRQTIAHNTGWLSGVNLLIKPLSFIFIIMSTHILGADDFGKFAFATAIVSFINIFFEGGINIHTVRSVSSTNENYSRDFYLNLLVKVAGGILTGIITILFLVFTHYSEVVVYLTLIAIVFIIFNALLVHLRTYFRAFEVMKYEAYSIAFEKTALIVLCGSILLIHKNVILFTVFYALTYFLSFLYTIILLFRVVGRPKEHLHFGGLIRDILSPASPFAFMNILLITRSQAGTLLLKFITHKDDWVGYYNAAYRLLNSFLIMPGIIATPLFPVIVRLQNRVSTVRKLLNGAYRYILAISALVAFPIFLMHKSLTVLLLGVTFEKAALAVGIIALNMLPVGLTYLIGNLVAATERQKLVNKLLIFETLTTILIYTVLITYYGYIGAAIASLTGDLIYLSINIWATRDYIKKSGLFSLAVRTVFILAGLALIQHTMFYPSNPITRFVFIIIITVLGLFALGILRSKEIQNLRIMIKDIRTGG